VEKHGTAGQATDDSMAHALCMPHKTPNTHLEYVILIAFLLQKLLREGAPMLRYTYFALLLLTRFVSLSLIRYQRAR
jgi:hypothetical protein